MSSFSFFAFFQLPNQLSWHNLVLWRYFSAIIWMGHCRTSYRSCPSRVSYLFIILLWFIWSWRSPCWSFCQLVLYTCRTSYSAWAAITLICITIWHGLFWYESYEVMARHLEFICPDYECARLIFIHPTCRESLRGIGGTCTSSMWHRTDLFLDSCHWRAESLWKLLIILI